MKRREAERQRADYGLGDPLLVLLAPQALDWVPLKEQTLGGRQLDLTELRGQSSCEREAHRRAGRVRRGGEREETCVMNSGGNPEHLGEFA